MAQNSQNPELPLSNYADPAIRKASFTRLFRVLQENFQRIDLQEALKADTLDAQSFDFVRNELRAEILFIMEPITNQVLTALIEGDQELFIETLVSISTQVLEKIQQRMQGKISQVSEEQLPVSLVDTDNFDRNQRAFLARRFRVLRSSLIGQTTPTADEATLNDQKAIQERYLRQQLTQEYSLFLNVAFSGLVATLHPVERNDIYPATGIDSAAEFVAILEDLFTTISSLVEKPED